MRIEIYHIIVILFCIAISPLLLAITLIILTTNGLPILFTQNRIGKHGKPFRMYKFRTMTVGAETQQKKLWKKNEAYGPVFKIHNDPRFTPIGKFLSHTGLDELPQIMNILRGEMAFFGPRPLPIEEANKLTKKQQIRHQIKPGIISPWIINGYHSQTFDAWMKNDQQYIKEKSLSYDVRLLVHTCLLFLELLKKEMYQHLKW